MSKVVIGLFNNREHAEMAINELEENGYNAKDMSIIMRDQEEAKEIADAHDSTSVGEGAASGAATGAVVGGIAGLLIGIGAIAIPGIGGLLIGGPLAAALGLGGAAATTVSGAATGAVAGGLIGALTNLGMSEDDARDYEDRIKEGGILLAVPAKNEDEDDARGVIEKHGAESIRSLNVNF